MIYFGVNLAHHLESLRKSKAMILKLCMASSMTERISLEPLKLEQNYVPLKRYILKIDNLFRFKMFLKVTKDNCVHDMLFV